MSDFDKANRMLVVARSLCPFFVCDFQKRLVTMAGGVAGGESVGERGPCEQEEKLAGRGGCGAMLLLLRKLRDLEYLNVCLVLMMTTFQTTTTATKLPPPT